MINRIIYLEGHMDSDSFLRDLRQTQSSLTSMPQQIREEYDGKLELIEKNYKENVKTE